ncbi:acyl-CoA thioesterase [Hydrogenophaga sp. RWCD_12]|uniref:acyl-CoA thioesterase n=1 Tax=Hydrogenophaga sp. RWCD_12 TaxID=3391190 RepID=UPI003984CC28
MSLLSCESAPDDADARATDGSLRPLVVVDMVWPDQSNHHGTLFDGAALSMLDRLAFIMGSRVLRGTVVTAAVGRLDFAAPVPAGRVAECRARVTRRGGRSAVIGVCLFAEDLLNGERIACLSGEFTIVRRAERDSLATAMAEPPMSAGTDPGPPPDDAVRVAEIVFPGHTNHRGLLHGGPAMEWIAKAGFVAATRRVRRTVVMASSERMDFVAPARLGDVVEVCAHVTSVGRRSVRVAATMWAESPSTGERRLCTSASLVYVAVAD